MAGNEGADGSSSSSSPCPSLFPLLKAKVGTGAEIGARGLRSGSCFLKSGGGGGIALRSSSALALLLLLLVGGSALVIMGSWISFFSGMGVDIGISSFCIPFSLSCPSANSRPFLSETWGGEVPFCCFAPFLMEGRSHWKHAHDVGGWR